MGRVKFTRDYVIKSSPTILYNFLSTPSGLAQWFADHVDSFEKNFSFFWDGNEEKAQMLEKEDNVHIRFKMDDADDVNEYLEFRIEKSPVTGDTVLVITDFADDYDLEDQQQLWDSQVNGLVARVGGRN